MLRFVPVFLDFTESHETFPQTPSRVRNITKVLFLRCLDVEPGRKDGLDDCNQTVFQPREDSDQRKDIL